MRKLQDFALTHWNGSWPTTPPPADDVPAFCETCTLVQTYAELGPMTLGPAPIRGAVEHLGPYRAGDIIFRRGDSFDALFAVRAGSAKTRSVGRKGREQVAGFHLPGEVIGLGALYPERFSYDCVALDTTFVCRLSYPAVSALATRQPAVQRHLFRLLSRELGVAAWLAGDRTADERMAAFLVSLGARYALSGGSATAFRLSMSRTDIGNYLRLVPETVSRVLTRFRRRHWIELGGHDLVLLAPESLRQVGQPLLYA